ncbi:MAG: FAD-dependent monooxygenase [Mycobacteriaceae bacterium]|nr:FAD-dependent monooxygenase [Mycobacteriaceae bacterium]
MKVGVVGGGFAGLAAAIAFRQQGHDVAVFEKTNGPPSAGGAISLARNALACLSILGVRKHLVTQPWSQTPATVRTSNGRVLIRSTLTQLTGGSEYATVPRHQLISWLMAVLPADCVRYSGSVIRVGVDGTVQTNTTIERFDLIVGADGAHSIIRKSLWPKASVLRPTDITGWAWITDCQLNTGFGSIWGRTDDFGILPLVDGRTYVYGGTRLRGTELGSFMDWPDPLPMLINSTKPDQMITPEIFETRPPRRLVRGKVVLIGDAAHTMRPTFGQGAALAMEDAITLAYRGTSALSRRWPRMLALYGASKAGSYVTAPRIPALETARNWGLQLMPDPIFGAMTSSVSQWRQTIRRQN